jgi:hypothetical protein|nr:MAG TPA: tail assembly chaperone protein [Caudoviricetes sp.]
MKTIEICGKKYEIDCNALTYVKYRNMFNRGIFDDLKILQDFLVKYAYLTKKIKDENPDIDDITIINSLSTLMIDDMDLFAEAATRMAYIMIYTANKEIEEYENWLEKISSIKTNDEWIVEVTEFAVNCFC